MSNFSLKLMVTDPATGVKRLEELGVNGKVDFSIKSTLGGVSSKKEFEAVLVRAILTREMGKYQKHIKEARIQVDIDKIEGVYWNGASTLMHYHKFSDKNWVSEFVSKVKIIFGNANPLPTPDFADTYELIEYLIDNKAKLHLEKNITLNMLRALKIRISFEKKLSLLGYKVHNLKIADIGSDTKPSSSLFMTDASNGKYKDHKAFWNKHKGILNGLSHHGESGLYYFIAVNSELLNEAEEDLSTF